MLVSETFVSETDLLICMKFGGVVMPGPMGYPRREFVPEMYYHVMSRGNRKQDVFKERKDYVKFLHVLDDARDRYGFSLFYFALMPNHVHLLVCPEDADMPRALQYVFSRYGRYFARKCGVAGHVWQGRYRCKTIQTETYLHACGNYIEENPVRAGLVARPRDWPYSSARLRDFGL